MDIRTWDAITKMHSKYGGRVAHATHVAVLVAQLFEKLAPLHGLTEKERTALLCAAHLHDIGHFVSKKKHHKHSHYLILHDQLLDGWEESHRQQTALIALNHRKKKLLLVNEQKKSERQSVTACIALLRLADALDREHDQRTKILGVEFARSKQLLVITLQGYPLHEHHASLEAKASLLLDLWNLRLRVEQGDENLLLAPQKQRA